MVLGLAQLFYGTLTIIYLYAAQRNHPRLAGRQFYDRLAFWITERGAIWVLRCLGVGLLVAGLVRLF